MLWLFEVARSVLVINSGIRLNRHELLLIYVFDVDGLQVLDQVSDGDWIENSLREPLESPHVLMEDLSRFLYAGCILRAAQLRIQHLLVDFAPLDKSLELGRHSLMVRFDLFQLLQLDQ